MNYLIGALFLFIGSTVSLLISSLLGIEVSSETLGSDSTAMAGNVFIWVLWGGVSATFIRRYMLR